MSIYNNKKWVYIPVIGFIHAGQFSLREEDILKYVPLFIEPEKEKEYFGLKVRGESMQPRIHEGDIAIVHRQKEVNHKDIAAVTVDENDAALKRIRILSNGILLEPLNTGFEPVFFDRQAYIDHKVEIIGKVIEFRSQAI